MPGPSFHHGSFLSSPHIHHDSSSRNTHLEISVTFSLWDVDEDSVLPFRAEINAVQPHVFSYMRKCDKVVMKAVKNFFFWEREIPRHVAEHILSSCVILRERKPGSPPCRPFSPTVSVSSNQSRGWCLNSGWHVSVCLPPTWIRKTLCMTGPFIKS